MAHMYERHRNKGSVRKEKSTTLEVEVEVRKAAQSKRKIAQKV